MGSLAFRRRWRSFAMRRRSFSTRRTRAKFVRRELTVRILVELRQGGGRGGDLGGGKRAVFVGVQRGEDGMQKHFWAVWGAGWMLWLVAVWFVFAFVISLAVTVLRIPFRAGRTHFLMGDRTVAVCVQGGQRGGSRGDFLRRNRVVVVGIERADERGQWWRALRTAGASAARASWSTRTARRLGESDRSGEHGEQCVDACLFHDVVGLVGWVPRRGLAKRKQPSC